MYNTAGLTLSYDFNKQLSKSYNAYLLIVLRHASAAVIYS